MPLGASPPGGATPPGDEEEAAGPLGSFVPVSSATRCSKMSLSSFPSIVEELQERSGNHARTHAPHALFANSRNQLLEEAEAGSRSKGGLPVLSRDR